MIWARFHGSKPYPRSSLNLRALNEYVSDCGRYVITDGLCDPHGPQLWDVIFKGRVIDPTAGSHCETLQEAKDQAEAHSIMERL